MNPNATESHHPRYQDRIGAGDYSSQAENHIASYLQSLSAHVTDIRTTLKKFNKTPGKKENDLRDSIVVAQQDLQKTTELIAQYDLTEFQKQVLREKVREYAVKIEALIQEGEQALQTFTASKDKSIAQDNTST